MNVSKGWTEVKRLEKERTEMMRGLLGNVVSGFKGMYVLESEEGETGVSGINSELDVLARMDIGKVLAGTLEEVAEEKVFGYLEEGWDKGWQEIAKVFIVERFVA